MRLLTSLLHMKLNNTNSLQPLRSCIHCVIISLLSLLIINLYRIISPLMTLLDTCARNVYFISLNRLVEVVYQLKKVFHLLYNKSVMPVEALLYFSITL